MVCLDECPVQLLAHTRDPLPCTEQHPRRWDYEYERRGSANLFLLFQPLNAWRVVQATPHRKKADLAEVLRQLVDVHFPDARRIHLVLDNLNIHSFGSLYPTFPPDEARRIAQRLVFHFTPVHGSWLNMAEIEFSVLTRQCLGQRLPSLVDLQFQVSAWAALRIAQRASLSWRFSLADARRKLEWLYCS